MYEEGIDVSRKNYIRQTGEHDAEIYVDKLPDCAFINAIKTVDICTARLLSNSELANIQRGGPDVEIISMDGNKNLVTRQQLCTQFRHCSGRVIKLQYLRTNVKYVVYRDCNQTCRVTKLPNNCTGKMQGNSIKPGSFIVKSTDGNIAVISPKLFRKAYRIPLNDVIKRHMNGNVSRNFAIKDIYKSNSDSHKRMMQDFGGAVSVPRQINAPAQPKMTMQQPQENAVRQFRSQNSIQNNQQQQGQLPNGTIGKFQRKNPQPFSMGKAPGASQPAQQPIGAPFMVTARIVNINKQLVGFMVEQKSTGSKKQMALPQVKALCKDHKIDNLSLVTKEGTNIQYLRGNGIVIQNLPELLV